MSPLKVFLGIANEPVEVSVGEGKIADARLPSLLRKLAGDDGGAAAAALIDDLSQVAALGGGQALGSLVIQDQQIYAGDLAEQPVKAAVAAGELRHR